MHPSSILKSGGTRIVSLAVFVAITGLVSIPAQAREPGGFGLFAMFKVTDMPAYKRLLGGLERELGERECRISLEGPVMAEQGDIGVRRPNRFIHLSCKRPLLRDRAGRAVVLKLRSAAANLIALEGPLTLQAGAQVTSPRRARSYIFKVSHYNNTDINRREDDLSALNRIAEKRPDRYRTQSEIAVTHAIGMARPDEVVILFYDSPAQGKRFRKANPKLLKRIGAFNKRHLTKAVYYISSTER